MLTTLFPVSTNYQAAKYKSLKVYYKIFLSLNDLTKSIKPIHKSNLPSQSNIYFEGTDSQEKKVTVP